MRTNLRRDLTAARKSRDRVAVVALRSALAAIETAEAVPADHALRTAGEHEHVAGSAVGLGAGDAARRELTDADVRAVVQAEVHERSVAAGGYEEIGRADRAERLRAEAEVLSRYLPLS